MNTHESIEKRKQKINLEFDKVANLLSEILVKYMDKIEVEKPTDEEEPQEPS